MGFLFSKKKNKTPVDKKADKNKKMFCAVYAISETGPVRDHNEDAFAFSYPTNDKQNLIAVVADGMGGHNAGEVASKMACDLLLDHLMDNWTQQAPVKLLKEAFVKTHQNIVEAGNSNAEQKGMGTTATLVAIQQDMCHLGHIGDSRAYLLRQGSLRQISKDHTLVNQMFEGGEITAKERDEHPMKNVLLQAMGTKQTIEPQITSDGIELKEGDRILLCSDGVNDVLSDTDIKDLLLITQPEFVLESLSSVVTSRNVSDNYTALLIEISLAEDLVASETKEQNVIL